MNEDIMSGQSPSWVRASLALLEVYDVVAMGLVAFDEWQGVDERICRTERARFYADLKEFREVALPVESPKAREAVQIWKRALGNAFYAKDMDGLADLLWENRRLLQGHYDATVAFHKNLESLREDSDDDADHPPGEETRTSDVSKAAESEGGNDRRESEGYKNRYVFRRVANTWEVVFGEERQSGLKHLKGMTCIAELLSRPNPPRAIEAIELLGAEGRTFAKHEDVGSDSLMAPILNEEGLRQCRQEAGEIEEELRKAEKDRDAPRIERLRRDRTELLERIQAATGKGGRVRRLGASRARKAAKSVSANMRRARENLRKEGLKGLAKHLEESIRAEDYAFAYRPAAGTPTWVTR